MLQMLTVSSISNEQCAIEQSDIEMTCSTMCTRNPIGQGICTVSDLTKYTHKNIIGINQF